MTDRIDWEDIQRRITASRLSIAGEAGLAPAERERILRERARALAGEHGEAAAAGETVQVLEFLLGRESYAVESRLVREVYPMTELTPLPGVPPFVLGIVNVRGKVLAVVDVGRLFDLPQRGIGELDHVVVLADGAMEFGVLANEIVGITEVPLSALQPPLPTLAGVRERYCKGIARGRTAVLDAARLLADDALVVREEA